MDPYGLTLDEELEYLRKKNQSLEDENYELKQDISHGEKIRMLLESRITLLDNSNQIHEFEEFVDRLKVSRTQQQKEEQEKAEKWKKEKNIVHVSVTSIDHSGSLQQFNKCYPLLVFHKKFFETTNIASEEFFNRLEALTEPNFGNNKTQPLIWKLLEGRQMTIRQFNDALNKTAPPTMLRNLRRLINIAVKTMWQKGLIVSNGESRLTGRFSRTCENPDGFGYDKKFFD